MNYKKIVFPLLLFLTTLLLVGVAAWLYTEREQLKRENGAMRELAELDKQEMENEYQRFADQYGEMKSRITNDSIVQQLTAEQEKTSRLLAELKRTKAEDAREITRLKRELATCRAVIRSYVVEIDSLNRLNQTLVAENSQIRGQFAEATKQIEGLNSERASLSEKVAIAARLDATGIVMIPKDKRGKATDKMDRCKTIQVNFVIAKNATAQSGLKTCHVRIVSPTGSTVGNGGTFSFENRTLQSTMKKDVEYGGQETPVSMLWNVTQALVGGTYQVSIFTDGQVIGSRSFTFK